MNNCKGNTKFSINKFDFLLKAIIFAENRDTIAMDARMIKTLQDYFATQPVQAYIDEHVCFLLH